jgi:hypothetical protein
MYGGAMVTGSSSNPQFQGNNFARKGVVYVSFNTRESIFAYPNSAELESQTESQNFGILDVDKALDWIHENIAGTSSPEIFRSTIFADTVLRQPLAVTQTISFSAVTRPVPCRLITICGTTLTLGLLVPFRWLPMRNLDRL